VFGQQQQEAAQGEKSHTDSSRSAQKCQQQVFDPELLLDLPARGSQRQPRGYFRGAPHHAHQRQPGQIGAGDEQDEARRQHQRQNLRTQRGGLTLLGAALNSRSPARRGCSLIHSDWHGGTRRGAMVNQ